MKISRIFTIMCVLMLCLVNMASAEKVEFKDKNYNFKAIRNIVLYDLDFSATEIDSIKERSLNALFEEKAVKEKLPIIMPEFVTRKMSLAQKQDLDALAVKDSEAFHKIMNEHLKEYAEVYIDAEVVNYETDSTYHPEYTTWETKKVKKKVRDNYGDWVEVEEEVMLPVEHPAYYTDEVFEKVNFHVYDTATGKEVYSRSEWRSREDDDGINMFGRICAAFFKDFHKLMK